MIEGAYGRVIIHITTVRLGWATDGGTMKYRNISRRSCGRDTFKNQFDIPRISRSLDKAGYQHDGYDLDCRSGISIDRIAPGFVLEAHVEQ